jgi:hypothetical protein
MLYDANSAMHMLIIEKLQTLPNLLGLGEEVAFCG